MAHQIDVLITVRKEMGENEGQTHRKRDMNRDRCQVVYDFRENRKMYGCERMENF